MLILFVCIGVAALAFLAGFAPRVPIFSHSRLHTTRKVVALTFDDGPSPFTPQVLDILKGHRVKATFFLVGENVKDYPSIVRQTLVAGHVVGNHSRNHNLLQMVSSGPRATLRNVQAANRAIARAAEVTPRLYRPPHGYRSLWGAWALHSAGFEIINWDNMTFDYLDRVSPQWIERRILKKTKPGSIIVLHDGLETKRDFKRSNTIEALPKIIKSLQAQGYKFVTIDELFNVPAYKETTKKSR